MEIWTRWILSLFFKLAPDIYIILLTRTCLRIKGYLPMCDMGNLQSGVHHILTTIDSCVGSVYAAGVPATINPITARNELRRWANTPQYQDLSLLRILAMYEAQKATLSYILFNSSINIRAIRNLNGLLVSPES